MEKITVSISISDEVYMALKVEAKKCQRSARNYIAYVLYEHIKGKYPRLAVENSPDKAKQCSICMGEYDRELVDYSKNEGRCSQCAT